MFGIDDAILIPAATSAVAGLAGGLIGNDKASGDREAARRAYEQSVADLSAIGIPSVEAQKIVMQQYQSQGKWTPELEQAVKLGDSNMIGVSTDPTYKEAQLKALSQLQDIGKSGGMTLSDQANLEKSMGNIRSDERGAREAILQDAHQRGGYGSGTALSAQLINDQGSANREHAAGLDIAAQAQARALQAIQGAGQLGSNLQQQEFGQKADVAKAQDAIAQWNAQNQQGVYGVNTGYGNQSQQYNLNNAQNLSNANVDTANKQEVYNKALPQQTFSNQLAVAQAKGNARAGQASSLNQTAKDTANSWAGIGSSVAQGATAMGQMANTNAQKQKDREAYGY